MSTEVLQSPKNFGWRKIALDAAILLVAAVVVLAIGEVVLRVKNSSMKNYDIEMWRYSKELKFRSPDPVLDHELVRNASAVLQSTTMRTNEWGLRGGPVPPPHAGQRRILVLGASITLGWGVPEEQTMTARLQRRFDDDRADAIVLNAGIGNYNTERYVELFFRRLTALEPTDILVHYFLRDAEVLEPGSGNWFLRNSELALTLWQVSNKLFGSTGEKSITDHYRAIYAPDYPGLGTVKSELTKLRDDAKQHGIRLYLAMVPDVHNLGAYELGFAHRTVEKMADDLGYKHIDLLPAFGKLTPQEVWAMPGDPHPNALGHEIMANALYPFLQLHER